MNADRLAYWQRRARDAERRLGFEQERYEDCRRWAENAFTEERRLRDRLSFVYSVAIEHGVHRDALVGPVPAPVSGEGNP